MTDHKLIDMSLNLPSKKGCVLIDNRTTDPSTDDRKYPVGAVWINRMTPSVWVHVEAGVWSLVSPQSLSDYVVGPSSSTDNVVCRFDGSSGKLVQESALSIDDTGNPTNTSQCAFSANISALLPNVTGNGTVYNIVFDNVVYDQNSNYNPLTGEFTAPITGIYYLCSSIMCTAASTLNLLFFHMVLSGGLLPGEFLDPSSVALVGPGYYQASCHGLARMDAGDTAHVTVYGNGAGADVMGIDPFLSCTGFGGYLVC